MKSNWIEVTKMLPLSTGICRYLDDKWIAHVEVLEDSEFFYEIMITGRGQSFHTVVGAHTNGIFLYLPARQFGCELNSIYDLSYNKHIRSTFDPYTIETLSSAIRLLPPIRKKFELLYFDEFADSV